MWGFCFYGECSLAIASLSREWCFVHTLPLETVWKLHISLLDSKKCFHEFVHINTPAHWPTGLHLIPAYQYQYQSDLISQWLGQTYTNNTAQLAIEPARPEHLPAFTHLHTITCEHKTSFLGKQSDMISLGSSLIEINQKTKKNSEWSLAKTGGKNSYGSQKLLRILGFYLKGPTQVVWLKLH